MSLCSLGCSYPPCALVACKQELENRNRHWTILLTRIQDVAPLFEGGLWALRQKTKCKEFLH